MATTNQDLTRAEEGTSWSYNSPDQATVSSYTVKKTGGNYYYETPGSPPAVISEEEALRIINKRPIEAKPPAVPSGPSAKSKNETANDDTGKISTDATQDAKKIYKPGKRLKNPLGYLSSYTYQLSLYMVTPKAYASFIASGRRKIGKDGVYLIAQSGGINNESRAPGFNLDYYIDNFKITTTGYKDTGSPSISTEFSFTITEPYGFSFISNLRRASDFVSQQEGNSDSGPPNNTKQLFIIGIRFLGYDDQGNLLKGNTVVNGITLDPNSLDTDSLFDRYYDILFTDVSFRIDGKAVVYNIKGNTFSSYQAFSVIRGIVNKNFNTTSATVGDVLRALMNALNEQQKETYKNSDPLTQYSIEFKGEGSDLIEFASMVTPDDLLKFKWPGSAVTNPQQSNLAVEVKSQPNNSERIIAFKQDTPILQSINQVISLSSYVKDTLEVLYNSDLEPSNKEIPNAQNKPKSKTTRWFNCSAETKVLKWHTEANDWQLHITYIIQIYETPMIDSVLAASGGNYYGPFKRYEYWYTGKNTEILSYSQTLNNAYFTAIMAEQPPQNQNAGSTGADNPAGATNVAGMKTQESSQGTLGAAAQAVNNYTTSVFDPSAQVEVDIGILGDPDFLSADSAYTDDALNTKFYGTDGYSINPNSGQVFIEIDFKEARDYSLEEGDTDIKAQPGTLAINDNIVFWTSTNPTRPALAYSVISVESTFSGGVFKQRIHGNMMPLDDNSTGTLEQQRATNAADISNNNPGPVPGNANAAMGNDNLKKDKPVDQTNNTTGTSSAPVVVPQTDEQIETITVTTRTGNVADDDGGTQ